MERADSSSPDWLDPFDYVLPEEQIARRPADPRDSSRLFVLERESDARWQTTFRELPRFLRAGDALVLNETRVLRARLRTRLLRTGRAVEVLFSHPEGDAWVAMLGPSRRLRPGDRLRVETGGARDGEANTALGPASTPAGEMHLVLESPAGAGLWKVRPVEIPAEEMMVRAGHIPLPPYLHREDGAEDDHWYQTVFAREPGAVAAPTAGLHFTSELLGACEAKGVALTRILLHVGPGTFLPVRATTPEEHRVLPERYEIPAEAARVLAGARAAGGRIVAVGTTTVRALETAGLEPGTGWTGLTIFPGHRFRAVDALVTNFHLPRSSLLLLVAAFAGRERMLAAYAEARDAGFRFYSYGDAMLLL